MKMLSLYTGSLVTGMREKRAENLLHSLDTTVQFTIDRRLVSQNSNKLIRVNVTEKGIQPDTAMYNTTNLNENGIEGVLATIFVITVIDRRT